MKKFFLLLTLFFITCNNNFSQWQTCYQGTDVNNRITGISFYSASTGYVASENWVGHTTDSGKTVSKKYVTISNVNYNGYPVNLTFGFTIEGVHAFSADTLLVYGDYAFESAILYSTSGGANWKVVYHKDIRAGSVNLENAIHDMIFPGNGNIGIAIQNDEIIRSTNRGATWTTTATMYDKGFFKLSFRDASIGYVAGPYSLYKTINAGQTWSQIAVSAINITSVSAVTGTAYVFVSGDGDTYFSANNGNSFTKTNSTTSKLNASDIYFINDSTGYATAELYAVYQTRNSGLSWEMMKGSNSFSYLGYGFTRLYFYNNQLGWACGENEYLSYTKNSGGVSLPKSIFEYDISNTCTTGIVLLNNKSHGGYSYQWLRNGVAFSTAYNASYSVTASTDTIKLITIKGSDRDTFTQIITASALNGFSISSLPQNDTVCSNSRVYVTIQNSITGANYQVGRNCCGYGPVVQGTGGNITVWISTSSNEDSLSVFTVKASRNGSCGLQTAQQNHAIRLINTYPVVVGISDTICTQKPFNITIPNSRPGYLYWTDSAFPKVNGTGGAIQLPTRSVVASYTNPVDFDNIITRYQFGIYVKHLFGCGSVFPLTVVNMIGRNTKTQYETNSHEMITGAALNFTDKSIEAYNYKWTFSNTNVTTSNAKEPAGVSYNAAGIQLIQLKTTTKEGCVDSAIRYVEVYNSPVVNTGNTCSANPAYPGTDSIRKTNYFVSRTIYEDEKGEHIVAGGYTNMRFAGSFYQRGYEGAFAAKYGKSGNLIWYFQTTTGDDYLTYNANTHIIFEQAIGDKLGNTYLLGHSLNKNSISDSINTYNLQRANGILIKLNNAGKIVWLKTLYNKDIIGTNISYDYAGGSLLRGKNDDIYVITHRYTPSNFYNFMSGNDVVSAFPDNKTGIIIHYDGNGNILRKKSFPVQYNNLRRFNTYSSDSYDRMPKATWNNTGKLVIYGKLNTSEMNGNSIDGFTIPFNTANIESALLFVDTTTLNIVNVKPVYNPTAAGNTGINTESYAIDETDNYFASYTGKIAFPASDMKYGADSTKAKSYIIAYDASGNFKWKKQIEGLQPSALLAYTNDLKVYGTNYINSGFTNQSMVMDPNSAPTTHSIKKLTIVTDSAIYNGQGKTGLGSIDNVVASLSKTNGNMLNMLSLGTTKEEETGTMQRGYGNQFWASGTIGLDIRGVNITDTTSTLMLYRLPVTNNCSLLPVVLSYFKANCNNGSPVFTWQTLSEINADKFEIEQSKDGIVWKKLATIPAKGNSSQQQNYEWNSRFNDYSNTQYRLKQSDKDGNYTYSPVVAVQCNSNIASGLSIYPNPSKGLCTIKMYSAAKVVETLRILNNWGQTIHNIKVNVEKGLNFINLNIKNVPAGVYHITLETTDGRLLTEKLIRQ